MLQLLKHKGHMIVNSGKHRGARYDELDAEAWLKYSKRAPGEPELQKFCRTALALSELDELCTHSSSPAAQNAAEQLAVVPYVAKKKTEAASSGSRLDRPSSLLLGLKSMWESFWALALWKKFIIAWQKPSVIPTLSC